MTLLILVPYFLGFWIIALSNRLLGVSDRLLCVLVNLVGYLPPWPRWIGWKGDK
jgi:hypothetical protein